MRQKSCEEGHAGQHTSCGSFDGEWGRFGHATMIEYCRCTRASGGAHDKGKPRIAKFEQMDDSCCK